MKSLIAVFGRGGLLAIVALVLLSLAIWLGGPYVAIADRKPFESAAGRLIAILVLVVAWSLWAQVRQLREKRTEDKLAGDIVAQKDAPPVAQAGQSGSANGDAAQLRRRFEEAVAALRKSKGSRAGLYALPWYIVIGPPGSGKTTAIVNSGLSFPLEKQHGRAALRGVGGTRNCDWWFTQHAVLIDTAGRYTTQDSDQAVDALGWREFLSLLRKYRRRRPINGVLVAMSASDLLTCPDAERREHCAAIRQRLAELHEHLKISLPVYFIVTKCDLLAGFDEFFDDLGQEARAQVWGATFPLDVSLAGEAVESLPAELDALLERLDDRVLSRIESERDVQRRAAIFAFPRQFASMRRVLREFVGDVFGGSDLAGRVLLRGVYFTSGTQDGTLIDRMLSALARTFGLRSPGASGRPARGKAYFIQRLLADVVFGESGLAGVNRGAEIRQALTQAVVYSGILGLVALGLIWMSVSFGGNRTYLADVAAAVEPLSSLRENASGAGLTDGLSRLDALRHVLSSAEQHENQVPLRMRAGLYQGRSIANAARDSYVAALNDQLAPAVAEHFRGRIEALAGEPDKLYEYLKAYLMMGHPEHLDPRELGAIGELEWKRAFAADPITAERVATHFAAWIAEPERVQPVSLDESLIERARASLRQASLPGLAYRRLRLSYAADATDAIDFGKELGLGADAVFVRASGVPLAQPLPALYSRKVFDRVIGGGALEMTRQFLAESWVLGDGVVSVADAPRIANELVKLYEQDYIRTWDALIADVRIKPTASASELEEQLALIASPSSPLKRLLVLVEDNTNLSKPAQPGIADAAARAASAAQTAALGALLGGEEAEKPGTAVTRHFEPLHQLLAGPPGGAPIDRTLSTLGDIQKRLAAMGGGLGRMNALDALAGAGQGDSLRQLQIEAKQLPAPIAAMVTQIGRRGQSAATGQARDELLRRYRSQVVAECNQLVGGRYPFVRGASSDVALADFGRLFADGGVFDTFFKESLAPLVDTSRDPWQWKADAAAIGASPALLAQFQKAQRIRQLYFRPGSDMPALGFTVTPAYLDAGVAKLTLEIDGQTLEYRHGPPRAARMQWPGPSPGLAAVQFEERGSPGPARTYQGPWALFRLLDEASVQAQTDLRYAITLTAGGRTGKVILEATSVRNPFGRDELRRFRCEL